MVLRLACGILLILVALLCVAEAAWVAEIGSDGSSGHVVLPIQATIGQVEVALTSVGSFTDQKSVQHEPLLRRATPPTGRTVVAQLEDGAASVAPQLRGMAHALAGATEAPAGHRRRKRKEGAKGRRNGEHLNHAPQQESSESSLERKAEMRTEPSTTADMHMEPKRAAKTHAEPTGFNSTQHPEKAAATRAEGEDALKELATTTAGPSSSPVLFHCSPTSDEWRFGWSEAKREWCCRFKQTACKAAKNDASKAATRHAAAGGGGGGGERAAAVSAFAKAKAGHPMLASPLVVATTTTG
eukprot:CAMPEP_0171067944 /NCGR_PEP_ID=MMETSP0766_2-20121228/8281_1 /TAXON_ID=439317 /ORGANISM="Gambierdiscus australes, Strain CAWD 149" /LENGTH=298 /DNA_ID=CAMNT_0011524213 /DNA_START=23 /DNA_END=920 /DNA_ORIENTATION=+